MKKIIIQLILLFFVTVSGFCQSVSYGNNKVAGAYFKVNGIDLYYEVYGRGEPLVLLHGNGGSIGGRADFIEAFSKNYKVIAIDSRCHGKSGCNETELNYDLMASDINGLLNHLKIDSVLLYGHSDGGIIGLILAMKYPQKIKKLVVSGANVVADTSAIYPEIFSLLKLYPMVSDSLMKKRLKLMATYPRIDWKELAKIQIPVLVTAGDRDAIREEHTVKLFHSIPNCNLFIMPGSTHYAATEKFKLFYDVVFDFFGTPFEKPSTIEMMQEKARSLMKGGR